MASLQKRHTGSAAKRHLILGPLAQTPLRAIAEDISLDIIYEDDDLVIINKPARMMVHAGARATG
jgi:23S rRNA pseudouridine1911/1915/1917 synthase